MSSMLFSEWARVNGARIEDRRKHIRLGAFYGSQYGAVELPISGWIRLVATIRCYLVGS